MPKGNPRDGIWFRHIGQPVEFPDKGKATTTQEMLARTNVPNSAPPRSSEIQYKPFEKRHTGDFKNSNLFSDHDNRHVHQDHGVYFGDGGDDRTLGRKNRSCNERLHYTPKDFLSHRSTEYLNNDFDTVYRYNYNGIRGGSGPNFRRYPKLHKTPCSDEGLSTDTTSWYEKSDETCKTSTNILGTSMQPYPGPNDWKYSFKKLPRVYPPFAKPKEPQFDWLHRAHTCGSAKKVAI